MLTLKPLVPMTLKPRFSFNTTHHHHHIHCCKSPLKLRTYAQKKGNDTGKEPSNGGNSPVSDGDSKRDGLGGFRFKWGELLNPDQDNFVAVALAGVLTWASLQVLSQLFFISFAILVAALKYSFIAALLIFILVTLL